MTEKAGRSRIIKNLAPSLTQRGKIKIGEKGKMIKSQGGADFQLPKKLDHFKVVSAEVDTERPFIMIRKEK